MIIYQPNKRPLFNFQLFLWSITLLYLQYSCVIVRLSEVMQN